MGKFNSIGRKLARDWFSARGNHSEMHIEEVELAAMLSVAAEVAVKSSGTTDLLAALKKVTHEFKVNYLAFMPEGASMKAGRRMVRDAYKAIAKAEGTDQKFGAKNQRSS